jgi:hypothetical protein
MLYDSRSLSLVAEDKFVNEKHELDQFKIRPSDIQST